MWAQAFSYSKISKIIKKDRKLRSRLIADIRKMLFSILGLSQNHIFSFHPDFNKVSTAPPQQNGGTPRKVPKIWEGEQRPWMPWCYFGRMSFVGCHLDIISDVILPMRFLFWSMPFNAKQQPILVQIMLLICSLPLVTLVFRSSPRKLHVTLASNFMLHQKVALLQHFLKGLEWLECWHPTMPSVIFYPLSVARRCPRICDSDYWCSFNSR